MYTFDHVKCTQQELWWNMYNLVIFFSSNTMLHFLWPIHNLCPFTNGHCIWVMLPNETAHIFNWTHNFSSCQLFLQPLRKSLTGTLLWQRVGITCRNQVFPYNNSNSLCTLELGPPDTHHTNFPKAGCVVNVSFLKIWPFLFVYLFTCLLDKVYYICFLTL